MHPSRHAGAKIYGLKNSAVRNDEDATGPGRNSDLNDDDRDAFQASISCSVSAPQ